MENVIDKALDKMLLDTSITSRNDTIDEIRQFIDTEHFIYTDVKEFTKHLIKKLDDMKELRDLFKYCR